MIAPAFSDTVTLIRRALTGYDGMGAPQYTETLVLVPNSVVWPEAGSEAERAGSSNPATQRLTWAAPPGTVVAVTDVAEVAGIRYAVDGPAQDHGGHAITGAPGRVVVSLVRHT